MYCFDAAYQEGLRKHIDKYGIAAVSMKWLRGGIGTSKLGPDVCTSITASLEEISIIFPQ
jgi:hypothetical protein